MTANKHFIADIPVKAIIEDNGRVLLTLDRKGFLELPGGRMHKGETPAEGLRRELKEELNLDVEPKKIIDAFNFTSDSEQNHFVVIYKCNVKKLGNLKIMDGEVKDLKWVSLVDLENLQMRQYKEVLKKYFKTA